MFFLHVRARTSIGKLCTVHEHIVLIKIIAKSRKIKPEGHSVERIPQPLGHLYRDDLKINKNKNLMMFLSSLVQIQNNRRRALHFGMLSG